MNEDFIFDGKNDDFSSNINGFESDIEESKIYENLFDELN